MKNEVESRFAILHQVCPIEAALMIIGNKWKGVILYHLLDGKKRFTELKTLIPGITQRMLTLQLRDLEKDQVVSRVVHAGVPPKVEYDLSVFGASIQPLLLELKKWGELLLSEKH